MSDHRDLIDRLDHLTDVAVAGTDAPPFDHRASRRRGRVVRHPRRWLAGVAAAAVAVAGIVVWAPNSDEGERVDTAHTTPSTIPVPDDSTFPRLLPTTWPAGFEGDIETRAPSESESSFEVAAHLLTLDGMAAATATVADVAVGSGTPDTGIVVEPATIDGRAAQWWAGNGRLGLQLEIEAGRSLGLSTRSASRDDLQAVGLAYDAERLEFPDGSLPPGWSVAPDVGELSRVLDLAAPPASWASAHRNAESSTGTIGQSAVGALRNPDADLFVQQVAAFGGTGAERVAIGGRPGVMIADVGPSPGGIVVVWAHRSDVVAGVWARKADPRATLEITRNGMLEFAASVRDVDPADWDALLPSFVSPPREPAQVVDGFELVRPGEQVVATGDVSDLRWMVTTFEFMRPTGGLVGEGDTEEAPGDIATMVTLYLVDADGRQFGGGGWGTGGGVTRGAGYSLMGSHHVFHAEIPPEVQDPQIVLHGVPREVVDVGIIGPEGVGAGRTIFALVEARSTPAFEPGEVVVTGTMPDGSAFRSPAAPG